MKWEDIEVGEIYHMPPLIYNGRFDFIVLSKEFNTIRVKRYDKEYPQTMFKTDITSNFIVKKLTISQKKHISFTPRYCNVWYSMIYYCQNNTY